MTVEINYDGWKFYNEMMAKYGEYGENHFIYDYGYEMVNVDAIKGLSYPGVLRQEKLDRLYHSVKRKGYLFTRCRDLHLYCLPDRTYTVCTGGNHRPYLAKHLNIKKIRASIEIVIPTELLTNKEVKACKKILEASEVGVDTTHPYFLELCERYNLIPSSVKVNIR